MVCPICITTTIVTVSAPVAITAIGAIKLRQMQLKQNKEIIKYLESDTKAKNKINTKLYKDT